MWPMRIASLTSPSISASRWRGSIQASIDGLAPSFPASAARAPAVRHALFESTLALRGAKDGDAPALLALYASTREAELAAVPWAAATKADFLARQFALQHHHYVTHFPAADFLVLDSPGGIVGRLYRGPMPAEACDLVIDVSLLPAWRARGLGTAMLRAVMDGAAASGREVALSVLARNEGARRLYERLGFTVVARDDPYLAMRWRPPG